MDDVFEPPKPLQLLSAARAARRSNLMQKYYLRNVVGIWLTTGILAALSCCLNLSAAHLNGEYLPVGNDSFYHARRILDTAADPSSFYEFDSRIHAPEGSLLTWPWGYDYALGWIVRAGVAIGLSKDPMAILIWIPVAAVFISIALLIAIGQQLRLSAWLVTLAALCFALAPTTQLLHGVGEIDHHYAELIFVLAALAAGLYWMHRPGERRAAALVAVVLGTAPAIHNGLFILQIPILATLFAQWLQDKAPPKRATVIFATVLLCSTAAIVIPSLPFRLGRFEFFTLSWFHFYVAFCTALTVVLLGQVRRTRTGYLLLFAVVAVLLIPLVRQIVVVQSFLGGTAIRLDAIQEMVSPFRAAHGPGGARFVAGFYSNLIWLAPVTLILTLLHCWYDRASPRLLFWIASTFGLILLSSQMRMHYFGSFALYLPWLVLIQKLAEQRPANRKKYFLLASLALVVMYIPSLRHQLAAPMPHANDIAFDNIRPLLTKMRAACAEDPGIVLADNNAGHYIRYYTECSVIANNFLLTPQHSRKIREIDQLFSLPAAEIPSAAPYVKYVLVRPLHIRRTGDGQFSYEFFSNRSSRTGQELLLAAPGTVPPGYNLVDEVRFADVANIPYARLYKLKRAPIADE